MSEQEIQSPLQDPEFQQRVFNQFMDIWITPEVMRRQEEGNLEKPLYLAAAQIIFFPYEKQPEIRINSEVRAYARMKVKPEYEIKEGDLIYAQQLETLENFWLTEDDSDCGHVTIVNLNGQYILHFSFIYNRELSQKHLQIAKQFLEAAQYSLEHKNFVALIDNLFSAAELTVKAMLLSHFLDLRDGRKHTQIHSRFNLYAKDGNVAPLHRSVFNKLNELRTPARYLQKDVELSEAQAKEFLDTIDDMWQGSQQKFSK